MRWFLPYTTCTPRITARCLQRTPFAYLLVVTTATYRSAHHIPPPLPTTTTVLRYTTTTTIPTTTAFPLVDVLILLFYKFYTACCHRSCCILPLKSFIHLTFHSTFYALLGATIPLFRFCRLPATCLLLTFALGISTMRTTTTVPGIPYATCVTHSFFVFWCRLPHMGSACRFDYAPAPFPLLPAVRMVLHLSGTPPLLVYTPLYRRRFCWFCYRFGSIYGPPACLLPPSTCA